MKATLPPTPQSATAVLLLESLKSTEEILSVSSEGSKHGEQTQD